MNTNILELNEPSRRDFLGLLARLPLMQKSSTRRAPAAAKQTTAQSREEPLACPMPVADLDPTLKPQPGIPWWQEHIAPVAPRQRSMQLLESLFRNYQEWPLIIARLHEERNMTFRKIAWFVGLPVARIRLAYADAQELRAQLIALTNSN